MAKNPVITDIKQLQTQLHMCQDKMEQILVDYTTGNTDLANKRLEMVIASLNNHAVFGRTLAISTGHPYAEENLEEIIEATHPVEIGFTGNGWFLLRLEPLAKTKDTANKAYIRSIIYPAMRKFFSGKNFMRYDNYVLIFQHVYSRDRPVTYYRDYDNVETKSVTDAVAFFTMVDDSPNHCSVYHCCATGNKSCTEVYVLPKEDFSEWLRLENEMPAEGFPVTQQIPEDRQKNN